MNEYFKRIEGFSRRDHYSDIIRFIDYADCLFGIIDLRRWNVRLHITRFIFVVFLLLISMPATIAIAQSVSSQNLLDDPAKYDKTEIIYKGEAIGDIMQRKGGQWVNVLDDAAIGIWSTKDLKNIINITGSYKAVGDIVEVRGIFNRMCEEHGGDLDIHAKEVVVLTPGKTTEHKINIKRVQAAILLTVGAMLAFGFNLSRSKRYL